jgi:hypothetical protein
MCATSTFQDLIFAAFPLRLDPRERTLRQSFDEPGTYHVSFISTKELLCGSSTMASQDARDASTLGPYVERI